MTVDQEPTSVVVDGVDAGYLRVNYTLVVEGGLSFPTTSELWVVPRGNFFFMIGAGTRPDEKTGSRADIATIVNSINLSVEQ